MLQANIVMFVAALFFCAVYALIYYYQKADYGRTKDGFLVSYRDMNFWTSAITIGIGWMWAPAFFISSFQAYVNGLVGFFWFAVGNILTLVLFSYGAQMIRNRIPEGYTFTGYIKERHGATLHKVYTTCMLVISMVAVCQLLVALSTMLSIVTGVDKLIISMLTMASVFLLSYRIGYRASVYSDLIKFFTIYGVFGFFVTYLLWYGFTPNFAGIKGTGFEFIGTPAAWLIFATFGGATVLNHFSTPWVDNSFTQTAYSIHDKNKVGQAFRLGSLIFAGGILLTAMIGFLAVTSGVQVPKGNELYTLVYVIDQYIGRWAIIPLTFAMIAGLLSVVDTFMVSISSIVGHDFAQAFKWSEKKALFYSRASFIVVALIAVLIANSGVDLLYLFLLGSVIKASIGLMTAALVLKPDWFDSRVVSPLMIFSLISALVLYVIADKLKIQGYQLYLAAGFCFLTPITGAIASRLLK